jgi:hypothetical protein
MARGRHTALTITLTAPERATLQAWQRARRLRAPLERCGRIVLLFETGMSVAAVARTVGVSRKGVYHAVRRFLQEGLAGLRPRRAVRRAGRLPAGGGDAGTTPDSGTRRGTSASSLLPASPCRRVAVSPPPICVKLRRASCGSL